jgi:putative hydrolase of the HAD superfamily
VGVYAESFKELSVIKAGDQRNRMVNNTPMRTPISVVSFDLDDTLWDTPPVLRAAEQALVAWLQQNAPGTAQAYTEHGWSSHRDAVLADCPPLAHDVSALRIKVLERCSMLAKEPLAGAQAAFEVFLHHRQQVTLFADVEQCMNELAAHYRLVAITNGNACVHRTGIGHWFTDAINPVMANVAKPHPDIYKLMLTRLQVSPEEVIHVGDHPLTDIYGAQQLGIKAVWVNRSGEPWRVAAGRLAQNDELPKPFAEIPDLSQLPAVLTAWGRPPDAA